MKTDMAGNIPRRKNSTPNSEFYSVLMGDSA